LYIASTIDVYERLVRPLRLVVEERILLHLAVVRDQPLVVEVDRIALVTDGRREVEHAPHPARPQVRTARDLRPGLLVPPTLEFLRVGAGGAGNRPTLRVVGMPRQRAAGAELAHGQRNVRMRGMQRVEVRAEFADVAVVPAEVPVVADQVGDACENGKTGR